MQRKKLQSFKDLNVWQKSSDLATLVYKISKRFPRSELYGLTNQMRRAVISISSNIAEGFKRNHKKEKLQFYSVAYGSAAELESQIEISYKLGYLSAQDYRAVLSLTVEVAKMIDGLIKSVRKSLNSKFYILFPFVLLYSIFYILTPLSAKAATLYLMPQSQTVYQGESFIVEVRLDTEDATLNACEVYLKFQPDQLEIIDISEGGSVLSLWPKKPSYSKGEGTLSFIGGVPGGFSGEDKLLSVTFRVVPRDVPRDSAQVIFQDNSKVLLNDGKGTPADLSFLEGNYEIIKKPEKLPVISSRTHPDQNKWYQNTTLHLRWDLIKGAEWSYLLSYDPLAEPDEIPDKPEGELIWMGDIEYKGLEDGIYYFTLKQRLPGEDWSEKVTFRAMIDSTPPEDFQLQIAEIEGKKYLVFATVDKTSGVDYYEIAELGRTLRGTTRKAEWKIGESPYLLEDQSLRSIIKVKAIDRAGNEKIAKLVPPYKVTWKDILPWTILALVIAGVIWVILKRIIRKQKRNNRH